MSSSDNYLDLLLRTKSFAGVLQYSPGDTTDSHEALQKDVTLRALADQTPLIDLCTCFWRRDIDYQPPSGGLDIGVCVSESQRRTDGSLLLRETGEDGSYAEGWVRSSDTEHGPYMALELLCDNNQPGARRGYWLRAGSKFAYAVGRPTSRDAAAALGCHDNSSEIACSVGKNLQEVVYDLTKSKAEILDLLGSYVGVAGYIDSTGAWVIQHSTHPELVGCRLVGSLQDEYCCSTLSKADMTPNGQQVVVQTVRLEDGNEVTRSWKVMELAGCGLPVTC